MSPVLSPLPDAKAMINWAQPPLNNDDYLQRIEVLQERICEHVRFICDSDSLGGVSTEAKHFTVTAFYERLLQLDHSLRRLGDNLRLA